MLKYLVSALIALTSIGGTAYYFGADKREKITFDPKTAQRVEWQKPTTDAEWAEDVKAESFDIKSTKKLSEMEAAHVEKLERVRKGKAEVFDCPECIRFQAKQNNPKWSDAEIEAYYQDELAKANWEVEKLEQSVERMQKELELRDKGFVVVEGEKQPLFGSINKPYAIRTPRD